MKTIALVGAAVAATLSGLSVMSITAGGSAGAPAVASGIRVSLTDNTAPPSPPAADSRAPLSAAGRDPFNVAVAVPPPPPVVPVPPPPPAPPSSPAFPYQVFGRLQEPDGSWKVYLSLENRLVPVEKGTELVLGYRVEEVTDAELLIRHVPSGQQVRSAWPKE